ncbi:PDZ and LIM domain protein Zasp isoform X30 [Lucilia sericata]|uniref:PDZ and LIM domain protein Zasp isoform X30 n=1 Tax=Lucilia sericata TaxID=13632 RepID=UPI0018A84BB8|nr:PDZ and LIM domain protein Zasp isoform X30 [Lucilia sericata]
MAQPQLLQIKLSRFDAQPWGFRLQGGTDFAAPLLVQKVNGGSLAEQAGLMPGDAVIKINDVDVFNLRHKDAQDIVVRSGNNFVITVQRGGSTWRPHVQPTGQMPQPNSPYLQTVTKTSLAHKQQESQHIGCGYNNAAKPFGNGVDGNVKSIVNKQYNSPVGIYSDESIAETLSAQAEVLAGGVLGVNFKKNEKEYQADKSEVLKFLREEESGPSTPEPHSTSNYYWTRSHAIGGHHKQDSDDERIGTPLQQNTLAPAATHRPSLPTPKSTANTEPPKPAVAAVPEIPDPRLIVMPVCPALQTPEYKEEMEAAAKAAALGPDGQPRPLSASGHPPCAMCGVGIVGVFVRIKDRNLHVECFKCATCGTSLKNQGYYNFNNKLYCDIHAKLAAMQNPPSGTEGYVPIPIKPNTKLSASTITSALNAHGYNNGVSNGSSTPAPVNQGGYARPYGAAPPAAAPKSPVSYPPQQQQWNQPPPTQPKPTGGNAYATLPRSNVGQQGGMAPKGGAYGATTAPKRGRGILNKAVSSGVRVPTCNSCSTHIRGPFITALGKIWCPEHFHCVNGNCRRPLQDIGFVEEKGDLYCEYCFEKYLAPTCSKCAGKIKGDCLNAIGKHFHPECFACGHCGKLFGNTPFFLEDGMPYCEADWNELFTTKCFACGFPVEAGDRWVEALNHNYHSQCFNCTYCKQNLEGQSFYNKGGRPFCKNHAR